jgi:type II secretion system protein C
VNRSIFLVVISFKISIFDYILEYVYSFDSFAAYNDRPKYWISHRNRGLTPDLIFRILGDRWLKFVVLLLLLVALAHQVSLVVWQLVPLPAAAMGQQSMPPVRSSDAVDAGANFQQQANAISRAFLFGRAEVQKKAVAVVEEAPETQLNYKLRGIYFSPDKRLSSAIVETRPNDSQHYLLEQELADKIILAGIERDYILISRYGKLERLNLEQADPLSTRALNRSSGGGSAQQSALLRSYKKRYTSNPMALATRFQAIPVQQDGKNVGFKLKPLRGESLLKKLSFEPDDVFTAVNGVALENPFEALDALKSLATASNISVTFIRNGSEQTQDFRI